MYRQALCACHLNVLSAFDVLQVLPSTQCYHLQYSKYRQALPLEVLHVLACTRYYCTYFFA